MAQRSVDPSVVGARFSPYEFSWQWQTSQLLARAAGCSIAEERDRPLLMRESNAVGHPMLAFNGALLARNRDEVMQRLIGGYEVWQEVGRWGAGHVEFGAPLPRDGSARVSSGFTEVGGTSKGHALVRFEFEVEAVPSGEKLAKGWMLLFLLGCGSEALGKLAPPRISLPERPADVETHHDTPLNVTFDWAVPSADWNSTHFDTRPGNPAPLVHGPRNLALVLTDAARAFTRGRVEKIAEITLGSLPAPHYPPEPAVSQFWRDGDDRVLGRLMVPAAHRLDGGSGDKIIIDQVSVRLRA